MRASRFAALALLAGVLPLWLQGCDGSTEPPPVPYQHFDVNHILSTGQSNAVANDGVPILSTSQPYGNLMFDVGVLTGSSCDGDGCTVYDHPTSFGEHDR